MSADFVGICDISMESNDLLQRAVCLEDWTSTDVVTILLGTLHAVDLCGRQLPLNKETAWLALNS